MGTPFRSSVDLIAYLRGPKSTGDQIPNTTPNFLSSFWRYGKHDYHPAEKSLELCKQLVEWISKEGDIILDPFCGSGTSLIGAAQRNRKFIGIEIEEEFYKIAIARLKNESLLIKSQKYGLGAWIA